MQAQKAKVFAVGGESISPGERKIINLPVSELYDLTEINIPVEVIRGKTSGPTLFITSTIHGDELNGIEIIRRLLLRKELKEINGTLIVVPIVNVYGFHNKSRYLPDRRDLNRCFPGAKSGSLAARVAYTLMKEVVNKSSHGIDLHTGSMHRSNLPQIRACLEDPGTLSLAKAFGAPLILDSQVRDGSLREATRKKKIPILLYEAGEALRFNESAIRIGVSGCLSVMSEIGLLKKRIKRLDSTNAANREIILRSSYWVRAPNSGTLRMRCKLGDVVKQGQQIAEVFGPLGRRKFPVFADSEGYVIGIARLPLANKGDAILHIATAARLRFEKNVLEDFELYS